MNLQSNALTAQPPLLDIQPAVKGDLSSAAKISPKVLSAHMILNLPSFVNPQVRYSLDDFHPYVVGERLRH